jgi:surface protein
MRIQNGNAKDGKTLTGQQGHDHSFRTLILVPLTPGTSQPPEHRSSQSTSMSDPSVIYRVVPGSEHSDEEAGEVASSDDGVSPMARSTPDATSVVVEAESFLERQDSDEYSSSPIAKRGSRCGPRTIVSVSAGLVLSLVLLVAVLSQTLGIVTSRSPSPSSTQPPPASPTESESNSEAEVSPAPPSAHLVDYTWDGKKCFESNAELRVAIDSYLLDRNNATLQQLYGLPIGAWCVRNIRDFSFAFASEGRRFTFPDRADELRDLMEKFNDDITGWDITGAKSLDRMFRGAKQLNQDLSKWDVSRVESMLGTFEFTQRFDAGTRNDRASVQGGHCTTCGVPYLILLSLYCCTADIRNWDVSKVRIGISRGTLLNPNRPLALASPSACFSCDFLLVRHRSRSSPPCSTRPSRSGGTWCTGT